jgi:hypothetical protein
MNIFRLLGDNSRRTIIAEMARLHQNKNDVKSNELLNKTVLGENFDAKKHGKKMQAHLRQIASSGVFIPSNKRGYYTYNPIKIHEAIKELQSLI